MRHGLAGVLLLGMATVAAGLASPVAKQGRATIQQKMPVSYVCTMPVDADVVEDKPGICRKCGMELQPARIESAWTCANNTSIIRDNPGKCPVDGRDLIPVTIAHFFVCKDAPAKFFSDAGACADGSDRVERREIRAHGDHNPRHGGQFFMATDSWHHLEGAYPSPGLFRVFFYDNFTKPLDGKAFKGSVVVLDRADRELQSFPLVASRDGTALEAKISQALSPLPLKAAAKITFDQSPEQRFDFLFSEFSIDTAGGGQAATTTSVAPKPVAPPSAAVTPKPAAGGSDAPAQPPPDLGSPAQIPPALADVLDETRLPSGTPELLAELTSRVREVETLVNDGNLSQVWLPATGAKVVALVLDSRSSMLPERQRVAVSASVKRIVTAAWELDAYGDQGNRRKVTEAYQRLASAVADIRAAYAR